MELTRLLEDAGNTVHTFMNTPQILYLIYFISFFFAIFVIVNIAMQKARQFKGKPGKVIAVMVSIIITGSIFHPTNGPKDIIQLFNGFGGFIFILALSLGIAGGGIYLFTKQKDKNFNLAMLVLTLTIYIAATLMLPMFFDVTNEDSSTTYEKGGFIGERTNAFNIFGELLLWIQTLSLIVFLVFLIRWGFSLFGDEAQNNSTTKDKKSQEHQNRINNVKSLLRTLHDELRETNNHFNNKINLLNDLRSEIGRLRNTDKGGRR